MCGRGLLFSCRRTADRVVCSLLALCEDLPPPPRRCLKVAYSSRHSLEDAGSRTLSQADHADVAGRKLCVVNVILGDSSYDPEDSTNDSRKQKGLPASNHAKARWRLGCVVKPSNERRLAAMDLPGRLTSGIDALPKQPLDHVWLFFPFPLLSHVACAKDHRRATLNM